MANYWDKGGRDTANPNRPRHNPNQPTPIGSNGLSAQETEDLIRALSNPEAAARVGQTMADPFVDHLGKSVAGGSATGLPMVYDVTTPVQNSWDPKTAEPEYKGPSLGESVDVSGLLGGILGGFNGIAQSALSQFGDSGEEPMSPEQMMEMLRQQYGEYKYNGPSAETMASREFDPQFAALSQMESGTTNRYKTNSKDMAGLYKAYADDVLSGRDENAQAYQGATKSINDSYAGAQKSTTDNMNTATNEMGKQLALLGQNEAAPAVMQEKQRVLGEQLGSLSKAQGASAALSTQLGANTYASDTARHGIAQQAGLNAGQELMGQYEDLMNQYGAQRLGLEGAKGKALNQYGMSIEDLLQKGNAGIQDAVASSFKSMLDSQNQGANREIQQGRLDLDLQKFLASQQTSGSADPSKMNPYDALLNRASQYNADPNEAANDAEVVFQTAMGDPGAQNMAVLMDLLEQNNPGWLAKPGNKALAYDYFNRILSGKQ